MNKKTTLTVQQRRPNPLPADDWSERQEAVQRQTLRHPSFIHLGNGSPIPCGDICFPEMEWFFGQAGGSTTLYDDQLNVVGLIDDNGVLTNYLQTNTVVPVTVNAIPIVSGSLYSVPSNATYITEIWFDYLYTKKDLHWNFSPLRTINILSDIADDTVVRVAYVSQ